MVSGLNYYTGIIFSGYTFGSGEAVVKGGRYDRLLEYFGKSAPAIGFVIVIDQLMNALQRQNIRIPFENKTKWFVYSEKTPDEAIRDALVLRREGEHVEMMPVTDENTAESYRQRGRTVPDPGRDLLYLTSRNMRQAGSLPAEGYNSI